MMALGTLVISQKLRKIGIKKFFCFPRSFSLGVITPLNFIKVADLIPSNSSLVINNFYRMFRITRVRFQPEVLHINYLCWNTEAILELRDMKYIVNRR